MYLQQRKPTPSRIFVKFLDPFDGRLLCASDYSYNPHLSADSFYSRRIRKEVAAYKSIFSDILQGRTPKLDILIL